MGWSFRRLLREQGHQVWCVNDDDCFGKLSHFLCHKRFTKIAVVPSACRRFNYDLCRLVTFLLKGAYVAPEPLGFIRNQTGAKMINLPGRFILPQSNGGDRSDAGLPLKRNLD